MIYGTRSCGPLGVGFICGVILCFALSTEWLSSVLPINIGGYTSLSCSNSLVQEPVKEFIDVSESWQVRILSPSSRPGINNDNSKGIIRSRFAATELGIREKLIVIILGQSSLSVALNASIGRHVPRMHLLIEESRIDIDISTAADNLTPYRPNGQHAHVHLLNTIFNKSMHELYDWFIILPDTTYVNPFRLRRFVQHRNFHNPLVIGIPDGNDKCSFSAGILLSNPVVRSLVQQRHVCTSIVANSDEKALETCIHRATNVTCTKDEDYQWWRTGDNSEGGSAIHDRMQWFSSSHGFNSSMTVSKLLSDADVVALSDHFIDVESDEIGAEIRQLSAELKDVSKVIPGSGTWPLAVPPVGPPPDRYQVAFWEYFTENQIFKIESNQNVHPLLGNDALDVREVIAAAKNLLREKHPSEEYIRMRNGYRIFNPMRGMEYILDLQYKTPTDDTQNRRVILCRPIHVTQLIPQVPYVKEDTDVTLVVPVGSMEEVTPTRNLLVRHLRMCKSSVSQIDSRRTRLVVAVRGISASSVRLLSNDLIELKKRCKSMQTETTLLLLKPNIDLTVEIAAMDEAIDHYGQQTVYVLLSPYADYQREFLDRIRINSIRHFQVFMPIPFAEFSPKILRADKVRTATSPNATRVSESLGERINRLSREAPTDNFKTIAVHKNNGIFDTNDYTVISMYGVDYVNYRPRIVQKIFEGELVIDLSSLFIGQSGIHVLRAIEPSLKLRYHLRSCPAALPSLDFARCSLSQKQTVANKAQLANVVFDDLKDLSVLHSQVV